MAEHRVINRIVFVCRGNICRSPLAEAVILARFKELGPAAVEVVSCGLYDWHVGQPADRRARDCALRFGVSLETFRASVIEIGALSATDLVVALDSGIRDELVQLAQAAHQRINVIMFGELSGNAVDVEDPFRLDLRKFDEVAKRIKELCEDLADVLHLQCFRIPALAAVPFMASKSEVQGSHSLESA